MPSSDHTTTSTRSAMVPTNLRVRIVMAEMPRAGAACLGRGEAADYKVRCISYKMPVDERAFHTFHAAARRPLVARDDRSPDRGHGAGRRRDAADRIRIVDRGMETGDGNLAA